MKILIVTSFFQFAGGSEFETIHTANSFASFLEVKEVHVIVYGGYNPDFAKDIFINSKVKFFKKPSILSNKYVHELNKKIKNNLKLESFPFDFLYWKLKLLSGYSKLYIITKSTLTKNYVPLLKLYKAKNNIVIKYTTVFFEPLEKVTLKYLSQVRYNIVTSQKQVDYLVNHLKLDKTIAQEILLFNEEYALSKSRTAKNKTLYDFGILGRFSEEKQFDHAINVIENLKNKGIRATLIIKGPGSKNYYKSILDLVKEKKLQDLITLIFEEVPYDKAYDFFDEFNCFLITSKYEGGPNVALEVMAYGLPILTYNVGAMQDRLSNFPELIAVNEEELADRAIGILNYSEDVFLQKCIYLKKDYKDKFSNDIKISFLKDFLITQ